MTACIVGIQNLKHMTGSDIYAQAFREWGIDFDYIYADKYGIDEVHRGREAYRYRIHIDSSWSRWRKAAQYSRFRSFVRRTIRRNRYDIVVVWGLEAALLISDLLLVTRRRYALNIRDYPLLARQVSLKALQILARRSFLTTISSRAFLQWLPQGRYTPVNSVGAALTAGHGFEQRAMPLRICFIGYVRFYEEDTALMNALANDPRFVLQFFGVGSERLEQYAETEGIRNVEFVGAFDASETQTLLDRADIINNLYGRGVPALDTAISLKYYLAVSRGLPILVYAGTEMAAASEGVGFVFDGDYSKLGDKIYAWYMQIDPTTFDKRRDEIIAAARRETEQFRARLRSAVENVS